LSEYTELIAQANEVNHRLAEISEMEATIADLKNAQEQSNTDQNLPLPESIALLESQGTCREKVTMTLERQTQENTRRKREVDKLRAQLGEIEKQRVEVEKFAKETERSRNAENMQEELASRKQVGWWYLWPLSPIMVRLQAMTATQMRFYGFKAFDYDEGSDQINLTLQVGGVDDVSVLIQLRNSIFDNAKVRY
jgi:hypothetical protein